MPQSAIPPRAHLGMVQQGALGVGTSGQSVIAPNLSAVNPGQQLPLDPTQQGNPQASGVSAQMGGADQPPVFMTIVELHNYVMHQSRRLQFRRRPDADGQPKFPRQ